MIMFVSFYTNIVGDNILNGKLLRCCVIKFFSAYFHLLITLTVIGIAFGTVVLVLMIGIAIISSILVYVRCYNKSYTRYEGICMYSVIMPRMLCGWCTDTAGGQDLENHSRRYVTSKLLLTLQL